MTSISGLTNPFENSILNSNLTQLEKDKQIADYTAAMAQGYEPPADVLAEIAALLEAGVLSPEALERMQTLTDQIMAEIGPIITSDGGGDTASITIDENTALVTTVTSLDQYSLNDGTETLSFSIVGGADAALFQINATTGLLTFMAPPDYEAPIGGDNIYDVVVQVNDGATLLDTQAIQVTVADLNDTAPVITSIAEVTIDENTTAVTTVTSIDPDTVGSATYSISGGADAALFQINATTGLLTFMAPPDYEAPIGGDNIYDVTVTVSDGIQTDTQAIAVTVTDVDEVEVNNDYSTGLGTIDIFVGDGSDIILGDVDGDGDLDGILVTEPSFIYTEDPEDPFGFGSYERIDGPITLLINNGGAQGGIKGSFTSTTIGTTDGYNLAVDFGDFDGDGDLDIVTDNQLLTNNGSGDFTSSTLSSLLTSRDIRGHGIADFDGDGDLDMIVGQDNGADILMINQGGTQHGTEGTFTSSVLAGGNLRTTHVMTGDMDGDGDIDAVRAVFNGSTQLLTNDGSGNFTASAIGAGIGNRAINVALGDLDSDGDLDMVVSQYGGTDTVHFNNGGLQGGTEGTFSYGSALPTSNSVSWSVAMADLDDDHDLDVFVVSNGDDFVFINDGSGNFNGADTINLGNISGWPAALGDVNGDGEIAAVDENNLPNINTDGLLPEAYVDDFFGL